MLKLLKSALKKLTSKRLLQLSRKFRSFQKIKPAFAGFIFVSIKWTAHRSNVPTALLPHTSASLGLPNMRSTTNAPNSVINDGISHARPCSLSGK